MVKLILLRCDEAFYWKMKKDKQRRERDIGYTINWAEYIKFIFGFSRYIK